MIGPPQEPLDYSPGDPNRPTAISDGGQIMIGCTTSGIVTIFATVLGLYSQSACLTFLFPVASFLVMIVVSLAAKRWRRILDGVLIGFFVTGAIIALVAMICAPMVRGAQNLH